MNPKVLQEILGHSTITMTMDLYSHVMPEFKKSAMAKIDYLYKGEDKNKVNTHDENPEDGLEKKKSKIKEMEKNLIYKLNITIYNQISQPSIDLF